MSTTITDDAIGTDVVDADGNKVGIVSRVEHGTAYVDPDPGLTDKILARLGWEDADEEDYPLQESAVATVTDDEIRLRGDL
jgi:hypothetical protein